MIAPEVGGGFGAKLQIYGEELFCAWAARKLGRPVKWVETRSEHMTASHHGRDQIANVRVGAKRDGKITALHAKIIADFGAYLMLLTPTIPSLGRVRDERRATRIPAVQTDITGVFTNKMATDAIRGAGRPEATHMIEVCIDQLAAELGMDPLELRRRNFIPADDFPHETALGIVYDSGDYQGALDKLLEHFDLEAFRARAGGAASPRHPPRRRVLDLHRDLRPGAVARDRPAGLRPADRPVGVGDGPRPHHRRGDRLHRHVAARPGPRDDVRPDRRRPARLRPGARRGPPRRHGDGPAGPGHLRVALARRSAARRRRARRTKVADKAARSSPTCSRRRPEDIELTRREVRRQGLAGQGHDARRGRRRRVHPRPRCPRRWSPGWRRRRSTTRRTSCSRSARTRASSTSTSRPGRSEVVRYLAVDDCGPAINPMLIDGQVHGGIAHAIGQALYEQVVYDEDGQLVTGTFVDYALPTAAELPCVRDRPHRDAVAGELARGQGHRRGRARSPRRRRSSTRSSTRCSPLGVTYLDMPLTPMRVWEAIQEAKGVPA